MGGALNSVGGTLYNTAQGFLDTEGQPTEQIANYNEDGSIDYTTTPTSSQKLKDIPGTVARNTQGGMGLISQDQKNIHNAIVNGNLDSEEGIAAIKNQIEMSQYKDPIMDMVNQNPLANPNINKGGLEDILGNINLESSDTTSGGLASITSAAREEAVAQETANREAAREEAAAAAAATAREEAVAQETANRNAAREEAAAAAAATAREEAVAQETANRNAAREAAAAAAAATARENARNQSNNNDSPAAAQQKAVMKLLLIITKVHMNLQHMATDQAAGGGGGGGGQDSCFLPNTLVTMANGSTKKIIDVDIGDEVAEGGRVFATGKFLNNELYDYKGVKVSGSHMVNEDGVWMRIRKY